MPIVDNRSIQNGMGIRFFCEVPNCSKSFSRADHLARHRLNHESTKKFKCLWPGCGKTFVRNDVYKKHYRQQHESRSEKVGGVCKTPRPPRPKSIKFIIMDESNVPSSGKRKALSVNKEISKKKPSINSDQNSQKLQHAEDDATIIRTPNAQQFGSEDSLELLNAHKLPDDDPYGFSVDNLLSSDELIRWLFGGIELYNSDSSSVNSQLTTSPKENLDIFSELDKFESNDYSLENFSAIANNDIHRAHLSSNDDGNYTIPTSFPFSNEQAIIDSSVLNTLSNISTSINLQGTNIESLQCYLESYWKYYHPQFPILNEPSFSTRTAHPILLLSMLTIGAYFFSTASSDAVSTVSNEALDFSVRVGVPLRFAIYESEEFKPPPKPWVMQSLIILETYEICCSSRDLHERANLHRGLSIQMLKRSPLLGGNPWVKYTNCPSDSNINQSVAVTSYSSKDQWTQWIEDESMKRCTLATFYLETLHAIVFGHDTTIDLHDVKLNLPCDEYFWKAGKYSKGCSQQDMSLLASVKRILHKKPVKTSKFGEKIILCALISLSLDVNDRRFEFLISESKSIKQLWQRKISEAFNFWDVIYSSSVQKASKVWSDTYVVPLRELYECYVQLRHYDFMVYAGAPRRLNVEFSEREIELVLSRIENWSKSKQTTKAIVLIYSYLYSLLISPINQKAYMYNPRQDHCLYRKQMISHMLIILWCYSFETCGPESRAFKLNSVAPSQIPHKEDGLIYLQRVKDELSILAGKPFTNEILYKEIDEFAAVLNSVTARENLVGLLRLFKTEYSNDSSEIAREHSRLLDNCISRSLGSDDYWCRNMFE